MLSHSLYFQELSNSSLFFLDQAPALKTEKDFAPLHEHVMSLEPLEKKTLLKCLEKANPKFFKTKFFKKYKKLEEEVKKQAAEKEAQRREKLRKKDEANKGI